VLGVVIGIAAVTTIVSVGQSAATLVEGERSSLGTNIVVVHPGRLFRRGIQRGRAVTLTSKDALAIAKECRSVRAVSPSVRASGQAIYGNLNWNPGELTGVGPDYLTIRNWGLARGVMFS